MQSRTITRCRHTKPHPRYKAAGTLQLEVNHLVQFCLGSKWIEDVSRLQHAPKEEEADAFLLLQFRLITSLTNAITSPDETPKYTLHSLPKSMLSNAMVICKARILDVLQTHEMHINDIEKKRATTPTGLALRNEVIDSTELHIELFYEAVTRLRQDLKRKGSHSAPQVSVASQHRALRM